MTRSRGRALAAALVTVLLVLLYGGGALPGSTLRAVASPAAAPAQPAGTLPVTVTLGAITPAVAGPSAPVTISGTVTNHGSTPITAPVVRVSLTTRGLSTRQDVSDWADGIGSGPSLQQVGSKTLGPALATGDSVSFAVVIPPEAFRSDLAYSVLPVQVDLQGQVPDADSSAGPTTTLGWLHTFLPWYQRKEFSPVAVSWVVPLTLPPDPALFGAAGAARDAAWERAIGPGSRLQQVITATDSAPVTWAIDPAILGLETPGRTGPGPGTGSTPSPTTGPTPSAPSTGQGRPAATDVVPQLTAALAGRLAAGAARHTIWELPYGDPDLSAVLGLDPDDPTLAALIARPPVLGQRLGVTPLGGSVAWPVQGAISATTEGQLRQIFEGTGLTAAVTSSATLSHRDGVPTGLAARKSANGLPLLAYDEQMSREFAATSDARDGGATVQQLLADSVAMLQEHPGEQGRTLLVAAPRDFSGSPAVVRSLFSALRSAPWLTMSTTTALLHQAVDADPEPRTPAAVPTPNPAVSNPSPGQPAASPPVPGAPAGGPDPLAAGSTPLSRERLADIPLEQRAVAGVASIQEDGAAFSQTWTESQDQLLSTRWRGHQQGWTTLQAMAGHAIAAISSGVSVTPSSVNFFADQGVIQITVVNDLPEAVKDVRLHLSSADPRRLRVGSQPEPLRIGAQSRRTVKLQVTAIAAGSVAVDARLSTANGTPLGTEAQVRLNLQPTSAKVLWGLGAAAALILVAGVYRAVRRGAPRPTNPGQEILSDEQ